MTRYERRYPGPRWRLVYGSYEGVEQFAVDELQRAVQRYLPYVLEVQPAAAPLVDESWNSCSSLASGVASISIW
jgi:hypothetical protein